MFSKILENRPRVEAVLSALDRNRLKLPIANPRLLFDDFDQHPVTLTELPAGPWSTPLADVVILAKVARCLKPLHILEVGSYRGYTTRLLAEHTPQRSMIVALDRDPRHGDSYKNTVVAAKIERRIGEVSPEAFATDTAEKYDLIFLDADHRYQAVKHDTEVLLPFLSPTGLFVWHDYANWGRFSGGNGVPELLHELMIALPIVVLGGSWLAAYSPVWATTDGAKRLTTAREDSIRNRPGEDPWVTSGLRG